MMFLNKPYVWRNHESQRAGQAAVHWWSVRTCELYDMMQRCWPAAWDYLCFRVSCIFFVAFVACTCHRFNNLTTSMCFELVCRIRSDNCVCAVFFDTFETAAACLVVERWAHEDGDRREVKSRWVWKWSRTYIQVLWCMVDMFIQACDMHAHM